jgi:hypothetical protein
MSRTERGLALFLRAEAVVLLFALPAVVMPTAWMELVHQHLGMGDLPRSPLVEYLTRSLSLLYAAWAPLLFVLAADLRRYLPVVWVLSWLRIAFGLGLLAVDWSARLPWGWMAMEGPVVIGLALIGLVLVWRVEREAQGDPLFALPQKCS